MPYSLDAVRTKNSFFMKFAIISTLLASLLLSACVNLKPQTDKFKLYTLGLNADSTASISDQPVLYITRPELPSYLEGSAMRYHTQSGEIASLNGARWGEDLGEGIARALGEYIQASGKAYVRSQYPWPKLVRENLDVRVLFKRFGATEDGRVEVVAIWQIRNAKEAVKEGCFQADNLTWQIDSPDTYVAQLNAALAALAEAIVAEL